MSIYEVFEVPDVAECPKCVEYRGLMAPPHNPSTSCKSGKQPHCGCDRCF